MMMMMMMMEYSMFVKNALCYSSLNLNTIYVVLHNNKCYLFMFSDAAVINQVLNYMFECPQIRSLLVKNMKCHASSYILIFALIKCDHTSFQTSDRS